MERAEITPSLHNVMAAIGELRKRVTATFQRMIVTVDHICRRPDSDPLLVMSRDALPAAQASIATEDPGRLSDLEISRDPKMAASEPESTGCVFGPLSMPPGMDVTISILQFVFSTDYRIYTLPLSENAQKRCADLSLLGSGPGLTFELCQRLSWYHSFCGVFDPFLSLDALVVMAVRMVRARMNTCSGLIVFDGVCVIDRRGQG